MYGLKTRRLGRFYVSSTFFHKMRDGEGANLFHGLIVLYAAHCYNRDAIEYVAHHPDFREVGEGCEIPVYTARFDEGAIYPRWG